MEPTNELTQTAREYTSVYVLSEFVCLPDKEQYFESFYSDYDLNAVCQETCIDEALECIMSCDSTDSTCISACLRAEDPCVTSKNFDIKIIMQDLNEPL